MDIHKFEKIFNDATLIESILNEIKIAIETKEESQLELYIELITKLIKERKKEANYEKNFYTIAMFINKILNALSFSLLEVENEIWQNLFENMYTHIDEIKFEKKSLLVLKTILKHYKKEKNYNEIDTIFLILLYIIAMQNIRREEIINDNMIFDCSMKGIHYIPATRKDGINTNELRETIDTKIKILCAN